MLILVLFLLGCSIATDPARPLMALDLDHTIMHVYTMIGRSEPERRLRPYASAFLKAMSPVYDIVLYSAGKATHVIPAARVIERAANITFTAIYHRDSPSMHRVKSPGSNRYNILKVSSGCHLLTH